jgi:hypothetical protein
MRGRHTGQFAVASIRRLRQQRTAKAQDCPKSQICPTARNCPKAFVASAIALGSRSTIFALPTVVLALQLPLAPCFRQRRAVASPKYHYPGPAGDRCPCDLFGTIFVQRIANQVCCIDPGSRIAVQVLHRNREMPNAMTAVAQSRTDLDPAPAAAAPVAPDMRSTAAAWRPTWRPTRLTPDAGAHPTAPRHAAPAACHPVRPSCLRDRPRAGTA